MMKIDWFTLMAQIVNFLILLWLLKHFLYGRIIAAMDKREQRIKDDLEEVAHKREEAEAAHQEYTKSKQGLDRRHGQLLEDAREEAEKKRKELIEQARRDVEVTATSWRETLSKEKDLFYKELRRRTARQVYDVSRDVLSDLATSKLEEQIIRAFIRHLKNTDAQTRDEIKQSLESSDGEMTITTTFEPAGDIREELTGVLKKSFGDKAKPKFEISDEVICGIVMKTRSRKLSWSFADYVDRQESKVLESLEQTTERQESKEVRKKEQ